MRRNVVQLIVIGVVASAIGIAVAFSIDWFPKQASTQAKDIDGLFHVLLVASVPVFVLVECVVLFSVWKFRMRPGDELRDGPPIHGDTRLEIVWTTIPAVLLLGLCVYTAVILNKIERAPKHGTPVLNVNVVGQQFTWAFQYPGEGQQKVASAQLYLPTNTDVRFHISSLDVIHAFWVPEFRMQIDAVPGNPTSYRIKTRGPGTYAVVCAELCGLGHAAMRNTVHVLPKPRFAAWLAAKRGPAAAGNGGARRSAANGGTTNALAAGKTVFEGSAGCGGCHTLAAAGTKGTVGPSLDSVLKGSKRSTTFIRESIVKPNAYIEPGYPANVMPQNFGQTLSTKEVDALVQYLQKVAK
ncbi:MAG TPA: cytochrome c oxidase subunit II [Solirubrobacteraceae bacterium]|nr:cytochrome c oxidase subunit II [Solirubrobacteraceae bacterium]